MREILVYIASKLLAIHDRLPRALASQQGSLAKMHRSLKHVREDINRKVILRISRKNCDKSAFVHYGGTVVY